ncbi:transmembrane protein, putative (macronuclear) [Tetrahymena thermophila SB210]|uniref:ER membrane protein complex subunit 1 n=1 Tax=Tetrahymena thermophila (strain SB210) TaxID=312017 RepID=Q245W3_TETTS|nr:transmembrane protein, putative [Tetrahymena thermophila SB210]EAS03520.2 transmembrane protein, putative [Tetrahymena thermophila SB210]|eukprot:XP_001023765.2 transmembrane protein, putative [Tetrahymena thermophila SB210]
MRQKKAQILAVLVIALAITQIEAKYAHNVGVTDWTSKNIGVISQAIIDRSSIYFLGKSGLFGHMSRETGQIQVSHGIDDERIISWKSQDEEYNEKILVQDKSGIFAYNVVKSKFDQINVENNIAKMLDHSFISQSTLLVLTQKELMLVSKSSAETLLQASENQAFIKLIKSSQNHYVLILSNNNKQVCVQTILKDDLLNKKISMLSNEKQKCWEQSSEDLKPQDLENILISANYVIFKSQAYYFKASKFISIPELQKEDKIHLDYKTGVFVITRDNQASFYVLEEDSFYLIYKFDEQGLFTFSFDHQIANKKTFTFMAYMQNNNSCKLLQINLENPKMQKQAVLITEFNNKVAESQPSKFWLKSKDGQELLVQNKDLRTYYLVLSSVQPEVPGSGEKWFREDGLALLDGLIMIDYNQVENKKVNSYYESLDKNGVNNPIFLIPNLLKRFTSEIQSAITYFKQNSSSILNFFQKLINVRSIQDISALNKLITSDDEYDVTYGLKKVVIAVNKNRTIYSIDSKTGEVIWKTSFIAKYVTPDYNFHGFFQIENRNGDTISEQTCFIYHSPVTTKLFIFTADPLTGNLNYVGRHLMKQVKNIFKIHINTPKVQQAIAIIDQDFNIYGYPSEVANPLAEDAHDNIFYLHDKETNIINGFKYNKGKFFKIWNYSLSSKEQLVDIQSSNKEQNHPKIALFDDTKVILKHIDYSNIAILTKKESSDSVNGNGILTLTILNCKTGRQIYSQYEKSVNLKYPINLIYDENGVFVSYYNPVYSIFQIWTVELFSKKMENNFVSMLQNYYFSESGAKYEDFNYLNENMDIIALEQKYGYSLGIKKMAVVTTKLSLTKRNLMIITPNNQIHSLDRDILSTRRAVKLPKDNQLQNAFSFESTTLPPYNYMVPIDRLSIISYHANLNDIKEIYFSGSNLESTILFVAYGNDVFMSSIAPDRTYDMINEDFNYILVTLSIIICFVGVFIAKKYASQSNLHRLFENKEIVTPM